MGQHVLRRLLTLIPVLLAVSVLVFGMLKISPGDSASILAGDDATAADIAVIRARYGLDKPIHIQYLTWVSNAVQGDLGRSIVTRRPVTQEITSRVRPTVELALASIVLATLLGMAVGVVSATRHNSPVDYLSMALALVGASMPVFWLGLVMIFFFSVDLGWLPTGGVGGLSHLVLPAIALGSSSAAIIARMTRSSMLETIRQDYVRTARAKGLGERLVLWRHTLKNGLIPIVTVIGLQFGYLLGGTVVTETVFSRPGVGRLLVDGIRTRDFPVVQGTLMILAVSFVLVNLIVDLLYLYLDPRLRAA
ncbi:MAG: nickel ABC transporter permease [Thermomicrobiales bacterium]